MEKKRNDKRQASDLYVPPGGITPYVGQWVHTSISSIGPVVAYIISSHPRSGMVDMWFYRPGGNNREYGQFHYSQLLGTSPYYGPIPPYQQAPSPLPSPYPPYPPYPAPHDPYPPYPAPQRSCRNYTNKSQQLACLMGLLPPI